MLVDFECTECKGHVCEIWALDGSNFGVRLMYWLMIWMPGLAFDELVLGQRTPSRLYICKACELPFHDRTYVHCPECDRFHNGRLWSYGNAFGHWLGLLCPDCGAQIPALLNVTSLLILWATAPARRLALSVYKHKSVRLLSRKRVAGAQFNYLAVNSLSPAGRSVNYAFVALISALCMDIVMSLFSALVVAYFRHCDFEAFLGLCVMYLLTGLIIWLPMAAICTIAMKSVMEKQGDAKMYLAFDSDGQVVPLDFDDESDSGNG